MKKIILTAVAVFAFSFANAQDAKSFGFAKGDSYVQGSVNSTSQSLGGSSSSSSSFAPSVGYFLTDNIALSGGFSTSTADGGAKASAFGIGAAYVFNAKNQFSTEVSLGLAFGSGNRVTVGSTTFAGDYKSTVLQLGYGANYFVSSHFVVSAEIAAIRYSSLKADAGGDALNTTSIGLDMSNISLGLAYKF